MRRSPVQVIALYALLAVAAALTLAPLTWLVLAAFKSRSALNTTVFLAPWSEFSLNNIRDLFAKVPFVRYLANSVLVAGTTTLLQAFVASLGGYALAKHRFRGRGPLMLVMLGMMMLPGPVMLAPMYELLWRFGLMDSHAGLIVPGIVSVFGILLFRQAMLGVPDELLDAGRIDGCGEFGLYWNIALPVVRPMMGAFCLIAFMGQWNSFLWPQIVLQDSGKFTLPIALAQMNGVYAQDTGMMMAGTLFAVLPVMLLFLALQREFISGLTSGAVKG